MLCDTVLSADMERAFVDSTVYDFTLITTLARIIEIPFNPEQRTDLNIDTSHENLPPRQFLLLERQTGQVISPFILHVPQGVDWPSGVHYGIDFGCTVSETVLAGTIAHLEEGCGFNLGQDAERNLNVLEYLEAQRRAETARLKISE